MSVCEQESETEMNLSAALLKVKCRHSCGLIKVKTVKISDTHTHHSHTLHHDRAYIYWLMEATVSINGQINEHLLTGRLVTHT